MDRDRRCDTAGVRRITVRDARRTCASLLPDLDVHPRVAMQILRNAQFAVTMAIYTVVSSAATRDALKRLGKARGPMRRVLLHFAAVQAKNEAPKAPQRAADLR